MALEFRQRSTLGRSWFIEVWKGRLVIGTIGKNLDGVYRYYEGANNELTPSFSDRDLDALKRQIEAKESN